MKINILILKYYLVNMWEREVMLDIYLSSMKERKLLKFVVFYKWLWVGAVNKMIELVQTKVKNFK